MIKGKILGVPRRKKEQQEKKKDILVHSIDDSYPHEIHKKYLMVETKKKKQTMLSDTQYIDI